MPDRHNSVRVTKLRQGDNMPEAYAVPGRAAHSSTAQRGPELFSRLIHCAALTFGRGEVKENQLTTPISLGALVQRADALY